MSFLSISPVSSLPDIALTPSVGAAGPAASSSGGASFADTLSQALAEKAEKVRGSEAAALGGIHGTVPIQSVVERVMEAERSLQAAIAIRDKVVSAWLDISKMQI